MTAQLRLPLAREPDFSRARFARSPANAQAMDLTCGHAGGALALTGPEGSGKTHLAHIWAAEMGASFLAEPPADFAALAGQRLIIENADTWPDPESLFHLINMVQISGALLLTARTAPALWPTALPDLRSRLNALTFAELHEPDDAILTAVLGALFTERHIRPTPDVAPYLLYRMERSVPAARSLVARLDEAAAQQRREINRALALEVLGETETGSLFG